MDARSFVTINVTHIVAHNEHRGLRTDNRNTQNVRSQVAGYNFLTPSSCHRVVASSYHSVMHHDLSAPALE
jgi:hypothetical protein